MSVEYDSPITIEHGGRSTRIDCRPGEPLLLAGLRQGLRLPYECATGNCGVCRARLLDGDVVEHWSSAPGGAHCGADEVLLCQTGACGGVRIASREATPPPFESAHPDYHTAIVEALTRADPVTLVIDLRLSRPLNHRGGQFVLVRLGDVPGYRAYSLASHPRGGDEHIRLVVRHKTDGLGTAWLFEHLALGDRLPLFGPLGAACLDPEHDRDLALIVGGSGISLATGVIEHALSVGHFNRQRGRLFFGVRRDTDAFFPEQLEDYARRAPGQRLRITVAFSDTAVPPRLPARYPRLDFTSGLVHEVADRMLRDDPGEQFTAFLAGPPPMVDGTLRALLMQRVPAQRIRYDKFT